MKYGCFGFRCFVSCNYITKCLLNASSKLNVYALYAYPQMNLLNEPALISGEDGRSRAEQLLHILRQLDCYVSCPVEHQRRRGCVAAYEMLMKFRALCSGGICGLGCHLSCTHSKQVDRGVQRNFSNLPCMTNTYAR